MTNAAETLAGEPLPVFEKDWWIEARAKNWTETYPEVNEHTMFAVAGPARKALQAAMAYAIGCDARHAQTVLRTLLHYTRYEFFAVHPDVGLNWSVWCSQLLQAYDLIYDTVPQRDRATIDAFFSASLDAIKANDDWWVRDLMGGRFNNHFAWHKFFIGSYGLFYGCSDLVDYAVESDQGIRDLIEHGSRDDGLWFESSINYHFAALPPIAEFARQLSNAGHSLDLWHHEFADGRTLRDLFLGPIQVLFPDGTLPTIGDAYGRRLKPGSMDLYFLAYDAYRLPEFAWLIRDRAKPPLALFLRELPSPPYETPALATRTWPEHGYVFLRTQEGPDYWCGDGFSVFLSRDIDSVHSHRDKFDLILFGRGAHIAPDVEALATARHAFSAPVMKELNRSTLCHNTLMVDCLDHNTISEKLELLDFADDPDVKLATIADSQGVVCPGVAMQRTVAATPDYVLDVFQVASDFEHIYDYLFHTYADSPGLDIGAETAPIELPDQHPWTWLRSAKSASFEDAWRVNWTQGDLNCRLTAAPNGPTEMILCDFPAKDDFSQPPIPMLIARRRARITVFAILIQAARGPIPDARIALIETSDDTLQITVEVKAASRDFTIRRLAV